MTGGKTVDLGTAPDSPGKDWAILVRKTGGTPSPDPDPVTLLSDPDLAGKLGSVHWGKGVTLNILGPHDQPAMLTHGAYGFGIAGSRQYFQLDYEPAAKKSAAKKHKKKMPEFRVPFLPSEQPFYDFELIGKDDRYPGKIKVGFRSKEPNEERFNGTAWVDEKSGEVESMGFSLSQNPTFVDEADATIVFGTPTELGRAPSELTFEAKGGFLFIHKHFKGRATLTNASLSKTAK